MSKDKQLRKEKFSTCHFSTANCLLNPKHTWILLTTACSPMKMEVYADTNIFSKFLRIPTKSEENFPINNVFAVRAEQWPEIGKSPEWFPVSFVVTLSMRVTSRVGRLVEPRLFSELKTAVEPVWLGWLPASIALKRKKPETISGFSQSLAIVLLGRQKRCLSESFLRILLVCEGISKRCLCQRKLPSSGNKRW